MGEIQGDIKAQAIDYVKSSAKKITFNALKYLGKEFITMIKIAVISALVAYLFTSAACSTVQDLVPGLNEGLNISGSVELDTNTDTIPDGYWKNKYRELDEAYTYAVKDRNDQMDKYVADMNEKEKEIQEIVNLYESRLADLEAENDQLRDQLGQIQAFLNSLSGTSGTDEGE